MTHLTQPLSIVSECIYKTIVWFEGFVTEYKRARDTANTINELNNLSDTKLKDIGLTRSEIYSAARKTHYGR